jgi:hypothetical protein
MSGELPTRGPTRWRSLFLYIPLTAVTGRRVHAA